MATYKTSKQTKKKPQRSTKGTKMVNSNTSRRRSQNVNIGGNVINKTTQRSKYLIYSRLDASGNEVNTNTTSTGAAIELLLAAGCIPSQGELGFLTDTDDTMMNNPNIEDDLKGKKGELQSAVGKFVDVEGPFYNLDPAMSRPEAKEREEQNKDANNYIMLASAMAAKMMT